MTHRKQRLSQIAKKHLQIPTLDCRNSDRLDFYDVSVWTVREALNAAYDAGFSDLKRSLARQLNGMLDAIMDSEPPSFTAEQVKFFQDRLRFTFTILTRNTEGK